MHAGLCRAIACVCVCLCDVRLSALIHSHGGWRRWRAQEVHRSGAGLKTLDAWCAKSKEMKAVEDAKASK